MFVIQILLKFVKFYTIFIFTFFIFGGIQCFFFQLQVVSRLSSKNKTLAVEDFIDEYTASLEDSKINMLIGLSVLELCLVSNIFIYVSDITFILFPLIFYIH